ncbi:aldose 1-epimerase [Vibrio sp. SCSIO 43136]|uniref:aldose 1-epimerase n=1 Tax=Vibrio sp. SCSIO 43136 TaxID=2819101 RepID=UPI0020764881|nr:aldose 1-epimerase [Vibrio sp. SCSIO 43136]USD65841.1 aldose 1-epimerase [Vibrio sp. SCSIO 43136]
MFKIIQDKFGELNSISIIEETKGMQLQVIADFGAVINQFIVNHSPFSFIAGYCDEKALATKYPFFSRSAKLFPFPNRLNLGQYQFEGQQYSLPANFPWSDHAVHGLVYNQAFTLIDQAITEDFASITLAFESDKLAQGYPFGVSLRIRYQLFSDGRLQCDTEITNIGNERFPFGDAWHPYFQLGQPRQQCQLSMPACQQLIDDDGLPTGDYQPFDRYQTLTQLSDTTLNHAFRFAPDQEVTLEFSTLDGTSHLSYQQGSCYRFLQLYTPDSEESLAIEPMTCPADAFNNGIGLLTLAPRETFSATWQCQAQYRG